MTIRSGFFNSVAGDRKYDAGRFAEYFNSFIGNGVFPQPLNGLQVVEQLTPDMTVTVKLGKAWINGYIMINDDDYISPIDPADGVLNRIDRIVARYDVADREIRVEVKKGTFASSPVAPELQRDSDRYELGLADIAVNAGATSITQANITDLRKDKELCGLVDSLIAGDINALAEDLVTHKADNASDDVHGIKTALNMKLDKPKVFGDGRDGDFNSTGDVVFNVVEDTDPPVIKQYKNFTLNVGHTMTVDKRSKGIIILCQGNVVINGTINMNEIILKIL